MKTSLPLMAALLLVGSAASATDTALTPEFTALLRVYKADGNSVLGQALVTTGPKITSLQVNATDAVAAGHGRCAFNLKYDEVSNVNVTNSINRLYSNDLLVAQNTGISLQAGVKRTVWTQAYLMAGQNNLRVVLNAGSPHPVVGWVRVIVHGSCDGAVSPPPPTSAHGTAPTPSTPATPVTVLIQPGSGDWNRLYTAWGYSNYATHQLKDKGYTHYADLLRLNSALTQAVRAQHIEQPVYRYLMAQWAGLVADPAFQAAMRQVVPATGPV